MNGRGPIRVSQVLAVTLLTAGFVGASFATQPAALASTTTGAASAQASTSSAHTVTFQSNGTIAQLTTNAATVGDLLRERNVTVGPRDYLSPEVGVPLADGLVVTYRAAVPVTVQTSRLRVPTFSAAQDVGALLAEQHVLVGPNDVVWPALADPVPANGVVRVERVVAWERNEHHTITAQTIHHINFSMTPGASRTISRGTSGERIVTVRFTQREGAHVVRSVVASHVIRKPRPRVIVDGVGEFDAFARFEAHGVERTLFIARSAMQMVATAYTANCAGCSGMTAIGRPAGHGIVAVDPRIIPLGTRLFIPGYGAAVAGDTGGSIHGNRIDLGFNSFRDAMLFGRRQVTVYRLK